MLIYKTLPATIKDAEPSDEVIAIAGSTLNSYIMQDGLAMEQNKSILDRLMQAAELYLRQFHRVINFNQDTPTEFRHWLNTLGPLLDEHASKYQKIYRSLAHLADKPYFATSWCIAFAVDVVLEQHFDDPEKADLSTLSGQELEDVEYTTRFMDNLFQEFHSAMIMQRQ